METRGRRVRVEINLMGVTLNEDSTSKLFSLDEASSHMLNIVFNGVGMSTIAKSPISEG